MLAFYSNYHEVKTMRSPRVPVAEQYRLIMECRKSGLPDHQWCLNNDINPGTFYNWVKRLCKNGCRNIPEKIDNLLYLDFQNKPPTGRLILFLIFRQEFLSATLYVLDIYVLITVIYLFSNIVDCIKEQVPVLLGNEFSLRLN